MTLWNYRARIIHGFTRLLRKPLRNRLICQVVAFLAWRMPLISLVLKSSYSRLLESALHDANRIIFVCSGNKCRSPFAERYLRQRLEQIRFRSIEVLSAGYHVVMNGASPLESAKAAEYFHTQLVGHVPCGLSEIEWRKNDLIMIFDLRDAVSLFAEPLLGSISIIPIGLLEKRGYIATVEDPEGRGREKMIQVYAQIVQLIESLVEHLAVERLSRD